MLRLTVRLACRFFLLWLILSGGLMVAARGQSAGDDGMAKYGLTVCALPCVAGFAPGQTELDAIIPLLKANIPALKSLREYSPGNIYFEIEQMTSVILYAGDKFTSMTLSLKRVSLAFLLERIGVPDCVQVIPDTGLVLLWDIEDFTIETLLWGAPPDALAESTTTQNLSVLIHPTCATGAYIDWHGFAPLWFYERLAAEQG